LFGAISICLAQLVVNIETGYLDSFLLSVCYY